MSLMGINIGSSSFSCNNPASQANDGAVMCKPQVSMSASCVDFTQNATIDWTLSHSMFLPVFSAMPMKARRGEIDIGSTHRILHKSLSGCTKSRL